MALARCNFSILLGSPLALAEGATVTVLVHQTQALAVPYDDEAGTTGLGNPYIPASAADAGFYAVGGFYDITAELNGDTVTWEKVPVGLAAGTDVPIPGSTEEYDDSDLVGGQLPIPATVGRAYINCTSQVNVLLPPAADRATLDLELIDKGGFGFIPVSDATPTETINGTTMSTFAVSTAQGHLKLGPVSGGYRVLSAQF